MNPETFYERGWGTCSECGCRRPESKLKDGQCADDWHAVLMQKARAEK